MNMSDAVERMEKAFPKRAFIFGVRVQRCVHSNGVDSLRCEFSLSIFPEGKTDECELHYGPSLENVVEQVLAKRYPVTEDEVDSALAHMPSERG